MRKTKTKKVRTNSHRWQLLYVAGCIVIFVVASLVRVRGAMNDLWLDEIWSLDLVREIRSPIEVFTKIHHDNNHYLNSLFMYFTGQRGNWPGYRIPAVVAGCGTVILAWLIGRRRNKAAALFSMLMVAFSYVLVLYSSEARGYGSLIFFSFLCFLSLQSFLDRPRWQAALLFSLGGVLGFLSHLTFVIFLLASVLWFWARSFRIGHSASQVLKNTIGCFGAPALCLLALYLTDIRHMTIGGGIPTSLTKAYAGSLAWTLGVPNLHWTHIVGVITAIAVLTGAVMLFWREKSDIWIFFAAVIVVVPIVLALMRPTEFVFVRYFIVSIAFLLLLLAVVLTWLWERGPVGRVVAGLLLIVYLIGNSYHVGELFQYGRGRITEAIQFMAEHSKQESAVTFGGDHDLRIMFVLRFYLKYMMQEKATQYYGQGMWPVDGLDWVICHQDSFEQPKPPGPQLTDGFGNNYELVRIFPTAPLSGVHWFVYHNRGRPW